MAQRSALAYQQSYLVQDHTNVLRTARCDTASITGTGSSTLVNCEWHLGRRWLVEPQSRSGDSRSLALLPSRIRQSKRKMKRRLLRTRHRTSDPSSAFPALVTLDPPPRVAFDRRLFHRSIDRHLLTHTTFKLWLDTNRMFCSRTTRPQSYIKPRSVENAGSGTTLYTTLFEFLFRGAAARGVSEADIEIKRCESEAGAQTG